MKKFVKHALAVFLSVAVVATFTPMFCIAGVMATAEPETPDSLVASATNGKVNLTWSESAGADSYVIFKNGKALETVDVQQYTDKKVKKNKKYQYNIAAVNENGQSAKTYTVTVKTAKGKNPAKLAVSLDSETVALNGNIQAYGKISPKKPFSKALKWYSSDERVATVSKSGKITGISKGSAVISARTVNGIVASCDLEVVDPVAAAYVNGKIYTVEGENWDKKPQQAMAVNEDGTIFAVGSTKEIKGYCNNETEITNLKGKTVLPGFIDSHNHPTGTAMTELYEINNFDDWTLKDTLATAKKFVKANPDKDVYWGTGFNYAIMEENMKGKTPRQLLDDICADKPILIASSDLHSYWLNTAALVACGIDKNTAAPDGGTIHKEKDGYPNGLLTDCDSIITLKKHYTEEQYTKGMKLFVEYMNAWGFTGCSTGGDLTDDEDNIKYATNLDKEGNLNLRMNISSNFKPEKTLEENMALLAYNKERTKDCDNVMVKTAKFFLDGVVEGGTAYMSEPYVGDMANEKGADWTSSSKWADNDALQKNMAAAAKSGSQIHVHAIGDAACEQAVDGIEYAQKTAGKQDYRNVITHLQVVQDDEKTRMGELGIIGAVQPFWHLKEPGWYDIVDENYLGKERASREYPVKSLQDAGVTLTFSGDYPVSSANNPFWAIEISQTRNMYAPDWYEVPEIKSIDDPTYLLNKKERVDRKTAIEAYTINGAYQMFEEDTCGSLKEGKVADFIVISKDVMKIKALNIDSISVLKTYKDGKLVYSGK